jgi:hypothetical protein
MPRLKIPKRVCGGYLGFVPERSSLEYCAGKAFAACCGVNLAGGAGGQFQKWESAFSRIPSTAGFLLSLDERNVRLPFDVFRCLRLLSAVFGCGLLPSVAVCCLRLPFAVFRCRSLSSAAFGCCLLPSAVCCLPLSAAVWCLRLRFAVFGCCLLSSAAVRCLPLLPSAGRGVRTSPGIPGRYIRRGDG